MISGQAILCIRTIPRFTSFNHQKKKSRQPLPQIRVSQTKSRTCECFDLHKELVTYGEAWSWQKQIVEKKKELIQRNEDCPDSLIVLQHRLVMYPIMNLRNHKMDLHWYLRALEEVVIRVLSSAFSIPASRIEGLTGVWLGKMKLAAIGIRAKQWITYHGLALNVTTDLTPFDWIAPCGLRNYEVGSINRSCLENFRHSQYAIDKACIVLMILI